MYKINETNLIKTIKKLNNIYPLVIPIISHEKTVLHYTPINSWNKDLWHFSKIRTPQPLKTFFYPPIQKVGEYPGKKDDKKINF